MAMAGTPKLFNGEAFADDEYCDLCVDGAGIDAAKDVPIASDMMSEGTHLEFSDNETSSGFYETQHTGSKNENALNPWHSADSPLLTFDLHSPAPTFGDCNSDYIGSLFSERPICSSDVARSNILVEDGESHVMPATSNQECLEVSTCSVIPALRGQDIEAEEIMGLLSGIYPPISNEESARYLNSAMDSSMLSASVSKSPTDGGLTGGANPGSALFSMSSPHLATCYSTMVPSFLLAAEATTSDKPEEEIEVHMPGSAQENLAHSSSPAAGPWTPSVVGQHQHSSSLSLPVSQAPGADKTPSLGDSTTSRSRPPALGPRAAAAKRRHRMQRRQPALGGGCGGGSGSGSGGEGGGSVGGGMRNKSSAAPLSAAEAVRGAVGGDAGQLSEEELLRRIRRVKNRESVEKCRNKQKMRMAALEKELSALRRENGMLLAVTKCVHGTYDVIASEVAAITGQRPTLSC